MILINGIETNHLPINDRGLQYGDGLFESIEVSEGQPVFLEQHLQRLTAGCSTLMIPIPDLPMLRDEIYRVCHGSQQAVIKVIITRGIGGRGYRPPDNATPTRIVSLHPFPEYPAAYAETGINTRFCSTRLGLNPALAGIKHLNRLEQVMARAEWDLPGIQEGLMLNLNDHVIEGTMTNLFYVKAGILYTSSLETAGVAGIIRSIVMQIAKNKKISLIEHSYGKADLLSADEAFVCNSIIGLWPIKQLDTVNFNIGKMTRELQTVLAHYKESELKCAER
jgi:4-amino-4-deoxychorismate lyase